MTKKVLITILALLSTFLFTSSVFATNAVQNGARDVGTEVKDSFNKLENGAQNVGNNVKGAVTNVGNAITGQNNNNNNSNNNNNDGLFGNRNTNNGYTATRTSATNNGLFGMNTSTMWTWIVLAIVGIAIVSLVWFYGSQSRTNRNNK